MKNKELIERDRSSLTYLFSFLYCSKNVQLYLFVLLCYFLNKITSIDLLSHKNKIAGDSLKRKVIVRFEPIILLIELSDLFDNEHLVKEAIHVYLSTHLPTYSFIIKGQDDVTPIVPGTIIVDNENNKGIVYQTKKNGTIALIAYSNGDLDKKPIQLLQKIESPFEAIRSYRTEFTKPDWLPGDMGYMRCGDEFCPFIVTKTHAYKLLLSIVGNSLKRILIDEHNAQYLLKDKKEEFPTTPSF